MRRVTRTLAAARKPPLTTAPRSHPLQRTADAPIEQEANVASECAAYGIPANLGTKHCGAIDLAIMASCGGRSSGYGKRRAMPFRQRIQPGEHRTAQILPLCGIAQKGGALSQFGQGFRRSRSAEAEQFARGR